MHLEIHRNQTSSQYMDNTVTKPTDTTKKTKAKQSHNGYLKKKVSASLNRVSSCKLGVRFDRVNQENPDSESELLDKKPNLSPDKSNQLFPDFCS